LIDDRRQLGKLALAAFGLSVVGLGIFLVCPTAVPAISGATWANDSAFAFLKQVDASGNACPSLHVAFAVLAAAAIARSLRELGASPGPRLLNGLWCAGILWSTIATRQHVVIDVAAGALLGAAVAAMYGRWLNRTAR
jgi:membrane-associated phospholipid phosphatase